MAETRRKAISGRSRLRALAGGIVAVTAVGYVVALFAIALALRFIGEDWWVTTVALYVPRWLFLLPLPFLVVTMLLLRQKKLLWTQLAAGLVGVFPLMGLVLPTPTPRQSGAPTLRVLSFNVNSGFWGYENVLAKILEQNPDVALIQELNPINHPESFEDGLRKHFAHVEVDSQFVTASRYPILSKVNPDKLDFYGIKRSPRFMQYLIDTPLGKVTFFNVHPISPRSGFYALRGNSGLRRAILTGQIFSAERRQSLNGHLELLSQQLAEVSERARQQNNPVVIGGDMNLPTLSPRYHQFFHGFQDGFERAGSGFGYTFPARKGLSMWLRLDRLIASFELDFVSFDVTCTDTSDHHCIVAELQRR